MNDLDRADLRTDTASWLTDVPSDIDPAHENMIRAWSAEGRDIRPAGWLDYHLVDVVVHNIFEDPNLVLVIWDDGEGLPSTLFGRDEPVAVRNWGDR